MPIRLRSLEPLIVLALALLVVPAGTRAQEIREAQEAHVVDEVDLRHAVARDGERAAADREAIRRVLAHPDVEAVAERMGLDLNDARSALPALTADQASRLAERARRVDDQLAAGQDSVTISTTWIIIGLLILIALILIL